MIDATRKTHVHARDIKQSCADGSAIKGHIFEYVEEQHD
jgi:hypothetical protein